MTATGTIKAALVGSAIVTLSTHIAGAATKIPIWPDGSPELEGVEEKHIPMLECYPATSTNATTPAVLICPAGGYKHHSSMMTDVTWLNGLGISAYIVKYRLPAYGYKHPAPMHDAQRAMRTIRTNAAEWKLDPTRIGVLGGSSGGHVATTLATHFDAGDPDAVDPVERASCRPDFMIVAEAVITMQGEACHYASRNRLLPADRPQHLVDLLSNEKQVTADTPPSFLMAGGQDRLVPADNSLIFFQALRKNKVAFSELHFFSHGGHGYGSDKGWHDLAEKWLRRLNVLPLSEGTICNKQFDTGAWEFGNCNYAK